jgi:D-inositol-3-phosphate glycosyltransferase
MFHTLGAVKNAVGMGGIEPELRIESEGMVVDKCDSVIAATNRERDDLIKFYKASHDKIAVIPCGINLDLFKPIDRQIARERLGMNGQKVVLYVGRINPMKGLDNLIEAVGQLKIDDDVRLVVVGGDGLNTSETDNVADFVGQVDQKELPFYYSAADVCVIPSYYESFCLVALESLACGTPLVATNVGGISGVVKQGDNGYIVTDNNPVYIADALGTLLSGQYAPDSVRDAVIKYEWANIAKAVVQEYQEVIKSTYTKTFS